MAKDLGKINVSVEADKQSFNKAGKEAGKGANDISGLGNVISGISRGGVAGGAQSAFQMAGMLKLAAGIGVAVAGLALFKMSINKVVRSIKNLMLNVENTVQSLSKYNAVLALTSAKSMIREVGRKVSSGERIADIMALGMESVGNIKDSFQPVKDAWAGIKASTLTMLAPIIESLAGVLTSLTIKIIELLIYINEKGATPTKLLGRAGAAAGWLFSWFTGNRGAMDVWGHMATMELPATDGEKEMIKLLEALKKNLEDQQNKLETGALNDYLGQVGVQLSGKTWNPWAKDTPEE